MSHQPLLGISRDPKRKDTLALSSWWKKDRWTRNSVPIDRALSSFQPIWEHQNFYSRPSLCSLPGIKRRSYRAKKRGPSLIWSLERNRPLFESCRNKRKWKLAKCDFDTLTALLPRHLPNLSECFTGNYYSKRRLGGTNICNMGYGGETTSLILAKQLQNLQNCKGHDSLASRCQ